MAGSCHSLVRVVPASDQSLGRNMFLLTLCGSFIVCRAPRLCSRELPDESLVDQTKAMQGIDGARTRAISRQQQHLETQLGRVGFFVKQARGFAAFWEGRISRACGADLETESRSHGRRSDFPGQSNPWNKQRSGFFAARDQTSLHHFLRKVTRNHLQSRSRSDCIDTILGTTTERHWEPASTAASSKYRNNRV